MTSYKIFYLKRELTFNEDIGGDDPEPVAPVAHCGDQGLTLGIGEPRSLERVAQLADQILGLARRRAVIPPFLAGCIRRIHTAIFSFCAGVMPPMPMFGRSLL